MVIKNILRLRKYPIMAIYFYSSRFYVYYQEVLHLHVLEVLLTQQKSQLKSEVSLATHLHMSMEWSQEKFQTVYIMIKYEYKKNLNI